MSVTLRCCDSHTFIIRFEGYDASVQLNMGFECGRIHILGSAPPTRSASLSVIGAVLKLKPVPHAGFGFEELGLGGVLLDLLAQL